jgi:glycosyltransferase involved in cell wall biosynthesis
MSIYLNDEIVAKTTCVLDQHNVDELVWSDYSKYSNSLAMKIFSTINFYKVKKYQRNIIRYFSTIVCVSPDDAEYMQRIIPQNVKTWVVPNGVDTEYFRPNFSKGNKTNIIMLCASMDVSMNIDAASYFARKIFPAVKLNIPDSEFWIVGRNPAKQVTDLKTAGSIFVTGSVDDVRPYYEKAKVVVAPYRFGGGTKLKILEAMAMNLPIVSTNIGCQGINTAGIEQIVIRDDQGGFAEAVINMLGSSKLNDTIPDSSARAVVCAKYSWESITRNLELKLNELK